MLRCVCGYARLAYQVEYLWESDYGRLQAIFQCLCGHAFR